MGNLFGKNSGRTEAYFRVKIEREGQKDGLKSASFESSLPNLVRQPIVPDLLGINKSEVISTFLPLIYVAKYAQDMASEEENNEIELISDGRGLVLIGGSSAIERFIADLGLVGKSLPLPKMSDVLRNVGYATQVASSWQANSGRWLKLTKDSAEKLAMHGGLMPSKTLGVSHAMVGKTGEIKSWLQVVNSPSSLLSNPAVLSGAAGVMTQMAMQQSMAEITDYLVIIDRKLNDVLSHQKNKVLARMDGVRLQIDEAMAVLGAVGRVNETTWSKIQNSSGMIFETQGMALRKLGDLADKLGKDKKVSELTKTFGELEKEVKVWVAVLAECFRLLDALAVIEIDRVFDSSPEELDRHRLGLEIAREERFTKIAVSTQRLLESMNIAADLANLRVLFHPVDSKKVVATANRVAGEIEGIQELLAIGPGWQEVDARPWKEAANDAVEKTRVIAARGVEVAKEFKDDTRDQAQSIKGKLSGKIGDRFPRKEK